MNPSDLPQRAAVLSLAAALAVTSGAIWLSPQAHRHAPADAGDPLASLAAQVDGAEAAQQDRLRHLAELTADVTRLEAEVVPAASTPKPVHVRTLQVPKVRTVVERRPVRWPRCSDFRWQQDAQRAYLRDRTDPYGLDGPPGARNSDGIACNGLPVDPDRPASAPAAAYVRPLPSVPTVAQIMAEPRTRFGLYTTQAPYSMSEVNQLAAMLHKRPDTVGYFLGFDQAFRPQAVVDAWRVGALPLLTWESTGNGPVEDRLPESDYALGRIIDGDFDDYIDSFARSIAKLGLPLAIRLDHEMNGDWYPWSEDKSYNAPGQYVQMWRHVVDRFRAVGADRYVIWVWAPSRIDNIQHQTITQYYPGDRYVDWVGMSGYQRSATSAATFDITFGKTLGLLRALTDRPILLAEIGATESGGRKAAWIDSLFQALPHNPDILGFLWFNLAKTSGEAASTTTNDWRINSSPTSLLAFKAGIGAHRYSNAPPYHD